MPLIVLLIFLDEFIWAALIAVQAEIRELLTLCLDSTEEGINVRYPGFVERERMKVWEREGTW